MTELARVLFGREDIHRRVDELGATIAGDYVGREPVLISVLKGGTVFLAHLMAVSPYGANEVSLGRVRILLDLEIDLTDRDVLLVEDIVDTGLTLSYLLSILRSRRPASLEVCTLLDRSIRRIVPLTPRYVGFDCPDSFVVGYGLDFEQRYRNLADILEVADMAALKADPDVLLPHLAVPA
jgi:hypoxanthine phosphoribosyltransferase